MVNYFVIESYREFLLGSKCVYLRDDDKCSLIQLRDGGLFNVLSSIPPLEVTENTKSSASNRDKTATSKMMVKGAIRSEGGGKKYPMNPPPGKKTPAAATKGLCRKTQTISDIVVVFDKGLTPERCHSFKLTYGVKVRVRFRKVDSDEEKGIGTSEEEVNAGVDPYFTDIGTIPLMVGLFHKTHPLDPHDTPGYFIVQGQELYLVNIEKHVNYAPLLRRRKDLHQCYVPNPDSFFRITQKPNEAPLMHIASEGKGVFSIWEVLHILGVKSDARKRNLCRKFGVPLPEYAHKAIDEYTIATKLQPEHAFAFAQSSAKCKSAIDKFAKKSILPFVCEEISSESKVAFIMYCIRDLERFVRGEIPPSNLDQIENKQFISAGMLMKMLTKEVYHTRLPAIVKIHNNLPNPPPFFETLSRHELSISQLFEQAFISSKADAWTSGTPHPVRRVKRSISFLHMLCGMRNVHLKIHSKNKQINIRLWHGTSYGYICPVTTPEGENVGVLKSLTAATEITIGYSQSEIFRELTALLGSRVNWNEQSYPVTENMLFLNHIPIASLRGDGGSHLKITEIIRKKLKWTKYYHLGVYICKDNNVWVNATEGRLIRPLVNMKIYYEIPDREKYSWEELVRLGAVEWVDSTEQQFSIVKSIDQSSEGTNFVHEELHDGFTQAIETGLSQCLNHDKAARNLLSAGMVKQAIGTSSLLDVSHRNDTEAQYSLMYPQRHVQMTDFGRFIKTDEMPLAVNVICAIATLPANLDDSIIFNQAFVDRGGFLTLARQSFDFILPKNCCFGKPVLRPLSIPEAEWENIGNDGIIKPRAVVTQQCCCAFILDSTTRALVRICRIRAILNNHGTESGTGYKYTVDRVNQSIDSFGNPILYVCIVHLRPPRVGDKFASPSAQKGVIGEIRSQEDMIFTVRDGIVPDLIISPCSFPSRLTIGHLISMLAGKASLLSPDEAKNNPALDCTPFNREIDIDVMASLCAPLYDQPSPGKEWFRDGHTGELLADPIFVGVIPYQRLIHMASEKLFAVGTASVNPETRAPVKGRKVGGGVRFGEMERMCALAHGVSEFEHEKTGLLSDGKQVRLCGGCDSILSPTRTECPFCGSGASEMEDSYLSFATMRLHSIMRAGCMGLSLIDSQPKRMKRSTRQCSGESEEEEEEEEDDEEADSVYSS